MLTSTLVRFLGRVERVRGFLSSNQESALFVITVFVTFLLWLCQGHGSGPVMRRLSPLFYQGAQIFIFPAPISCLGD
jgi:hypothetical protein